MEIFLDVPLAVLFLRAVALSVFLLAASFRQADRRISGPIARLSKSKRMITFALTGATLVLHFRSSHHLAATSHANFGNIRSTSNLTILVRFMNLKFPRWTRGKTGRNFKFTALVQDTPAFIAIADAAFSLRAADFSRTHRINRPGM
jgi:hypothetical protein